MREKSCETGVGVSSYNVAMARNDLTAMRAREKCASFRVLRVFRGSSFNPRLHLPPKYEIIRAGRRWRGDRGARVGVSNYYSIGISNDLAALKAREERASYVGQMHFKSIVDSCMRLADAIDSPSSPYKPVAITLSALGLLFAVETAAAYSRGNYWY